MKRVFPLLLAIACAVVFAPSAGAAVPTINSLTHTVVQNPNDAYDISVDWELDQTDGGGATTQVVVFAVRAWNSDCSGAFPGSPSWEYSNFHYISATTTSMSDVISLPSGVNTYMPLCVGVHAVGMNDVVSATKLDFGPSQWTLSGENYLAPTLIDIGVDVTPNGLPTSYHLNYYKKTAESPDCLNPTAEELASAQDSTTETITDDLHGEHSVYPEAAGLDPESDYCIALRIGNSARNDDTEFHWLYTTGSPIPSIDSESYSGVDGGINFDVDVTPNATLSDTQLKFQYFKKVGADCTLVPGQESYYTFPALTPARGSVSANARSSIDNLDAHSYYCVRAFAINGGGGTTPGAFVTVRTVLQTPVTVGHKYFQPKSQNLPVGANMGYALGLFDNGAYADLGESNVTSFDLFRLPAGECDADGIVGQTPTYSATPVSWGASDGATDLDYDFDAGARGTENCIHSHTDSPWGDSFDRDLFVPFKSSVAPAFSNVQTSRTGNSITLTADLDPGELASSVTFFSQPLPDGQTCDGSDPSTVALTAIDSDLSNPHSVSYTLSGLPDYARYCVWFMSGNDMGQGASNWQSVQTLDKTPPTKPTKPTSSPESVMAGMATITARATWSPSADNSGSIEGYNVFVDGSKVASNISATEYSVEVNCGTSRQLRVSAIDAAGNESELSDALTLSGAACSHPTPPARTCIAKIKKRTLTLRGAKKKRVKVSIKATVSSDGQSVSFKVNGKGVKSSYRSSGGKIRNGKFTGGPGTVSIQLRFQGKTKTVKLKVGRLAC